MKKPPQEYAAPGRGYVITPAPHTGTGRSGGHDVSGYATHTGNARSTEDVTVRNGTAPIIERGEAEDEEIMDAMAESIPETGNSPD